MYLTDNCYLCKQITKTETIMKRIAAIDILRALTMLWMLFVNDIPALQGVPHWLFHAEATEDMLGFSDLVFPAFLFCVGMSIPFAIDSRLKRGASMGATMGHVLLRSLALIVMGLFLLNRHHGEEGIASNYMLLMSVAGFFLIWTDYPPKHQWLFRWLRYAGVALLAGLLLYCDITGHPFETGWWGILGLIGWTYLVCTLAYLMVRSWKVSIWGMWLLFVLLCVLNESSLIPEAYFSRVVILPFVPGGWTHHAIGFSGIVASLLLRRLTANGRYWQLVGVYSLLGLAVLVLGFVSHHWWIISKIQATPTWLFFSLAVNFWLLAVVFCLSDIFGKKQWFALIAPAGSATLTCYLIPYIWYPLREIFGINIPGWYGITGILISLVYAFLIIQITRLFVSFGLKVKL